MFAQGSQRDAEPVARGVGAVADGKVVVSSERIGMLRAKHPLAQPKGLFIRDESLLMPTDQAAATMVHRRSLSAPEGTAIGSLADRWLVAWNALDLDSVLALYATEARHTSAMIRVLGSETDTLEGRSAIGDYFRRGMETYPDLRFEPISVSTGPRTTVIEHVRHGVGPSEPTTEILATNESGLILHSRVYHHHAQGN